MKRIPLIISILAALTLLMSGIGTRAQLWSFRTGFELLRWSARAGLLAAGLAVIFLLIPKLRQRSAVALGVAIIIGLLTAYVPWSWQRRGRAAPPIHDITTDTERPPEFVAVLPLRADAPNEAGYGGAEIASQQRQAYPDLQPLVLNVQPDSAFVLARNAAERMGWEIVAADSSAKRIEATATTRWFGFKDDVVVRIEPAPTGSRIDVRSVSRVGRGDVGTNARRIRAYLRRLEESVA
jgi:uncharacterized protein (DUF1499 family)